MGFDEIVDIVLTLEGRGQIVDDPEDDGGLTKWGISQAAHPQLSRADIRALTKAQAIAIYRRAYWDALQVTKFPKKVRLAVFDAAVNHGIAGATRLIQKAANAGGAKLLIDGKLGPLTLAAVKGFDPVEFLVLLSAERLSLYQQLSDFKTFGKGWTKRILRIAFATR